MALGEIGIGFRRDARAATIGAEVQAVIRTDDVFALHPAFAQWRAAMTANVPGGVEFAAGPIKYDRLIQQRDGIGFVSHVCRECDGVPVLAERLAVLCGEGAALGDRVPGNGLAGYCGRGHVSSP